MKKFIFIGVMLCLLLSLKATTLWENEVPIRLGANIEWYSSGAKTSDGGVIYVWSDTRRGDRDIWAQKVDAQGNIIWNEPALIDGKLNHQDEPVIIQTSDDNFVIAWLDYLNDPNGTDIYAQKINSQGQLLWQTGGIPVCIANENQTYIKIVSDNSGGVYILWNDYRNYYWKLYGQHLDSQGNPIWDINGIQLDNANSFNYYYNALSDGQDGLIVAYPNFDGTNQNIYINRYLYDGSMAWNEPVVLDNSPGYHLNIEASLLSNGEIMFSWVCSLTDIKKLYAQKMNINGDLLWQNSLLIFDNFSSSNIDYLYSPSIISTSDNAVIIAWEGNISDAKSSGIIAQKVNFDGTFLWNEGGVNVGGIPLNNAVLESDFNGGCYIAWIDCRNTDSVPQENFDIYGQHLSTSGQPLWEPNGRIICNDPYKQVNPILIFNIDMIYCAWSDERNSSPGIYYQVYNSNDIAQLVENGKMIFWGIGGGIDRPLIANRSQDVVVMWCDSRDYETLGYKIFFQFLNSDGSLKLEPNGRPITLPYSGNQLSPSVVVLPDDSIIFAWVDDRNGNDKIYLQQIDSNGNRLWGDYGIQLTESNPFYQYNPHISYLPDLDQVYIGWSSFDYQNGNPTPFSVYGQMLYNGEKQWGPNGILISVNDGADENSTEFYINDVKGNYFIWTTVDYTQFYQKIFVKKVAPNGEASPGWEEYGLSVSMSNDIYTYQYYPLVTLTSEGIFVLWTKSVYNSNNLFYFAQHISSDGERLWGPEGMEVLTNAYINNYSVVENPLFQNEIVVVWDNYINNLDIKAQKFSLQGLPLWNENGIYIIQNPENQFEPIIGRFDNGGMIVAWTESPQYSTYYDNNLYYNYLNNDGTVGGSVSEGYVLCNIFNNQNSPKLTIHNNEAYIIWSDYRSSNEAFEDGYNSLYAQKISNETPINDPSTPFISNFQLLQNYPNPFNPSTNIKFLVNDITLPYTLNIYNIKGQLIKTLFKGNLEKGTHNIIWDGTDSNDKPVSSGIYLYSLSNGKDNQIKGMVLMK